MGGLNRTPGGGGGSLYGGGSAGLEFLFRYVAEDECEFCCNGGPGGGL